LGEALLIDERTQSQTKIAQRKRAGRFFISNTIDLTGSIMKHDDRNLCDGANHD
jgi:hypothetical protein